MRRTTKTHSWISIDDIDDLSGFRDFLNNGHSPGSLVDFLRKRFTSETLSCLSKRPSPNTLGDLLAQDLSHITEERQLFDPSVFESAKLSQITRNNLGRELEGDALRAHNKRLLAETLPQFIKYSPLQLALDRFREQEGGDSLNQLLSALNGMILTFLYVQGCTEEDAQDLRQETLLKVTRYLPQFRGRIDRQLKTLAYRIAYCRHVELLRKRKRKKEELREPTALEQEVDQARQDHRVPDGVKVDLEFADRMLASMKPIDRAILQLSYHDGCTIEEIAEIMGMSYGAAKRRLYLAAERAQGLLKTFK